MYVVPDPRTQAFARIPESRCLIVCNSDQSWSVAAASAYATARGVPVGNIVQVALGTSRDWDPGSNAVIGDLVTTVRNAWSSKLARAILVAPGCPNRVRVRGVTNAGINYNPGDVGFPSFVHLMMIVPAYHQIISGGTIVSCREPNGSGNWKWWSYSGTSAGTFEMLNGRVAWKLGLSDNRGLVDESYETIDIRPLDTSPFSVASGSLPTPLATTYLGWLGSRVIPAGRIGWGAWRLPSSDFLEGAANWDGPLNSSFAADALTSQPAPILVSLNNSTGSMERWSGIAKAASDWGYDVAYYYRTTSISSLVQTRCPVAGAVWSKDDFEGGSVVGESFYVFGGDSLNADDPVRTEPFKSALAPVNGAAVVEMGASYGYEYGIRSLLTGGASASMDVSHRTAAETLNAWVSLWQVLRGMNGLEAGWNNVTSASPAGDPLHRPFHFDPAGSLELYGEAPPPEPPPPPPPTDPDYSPPYWTSFGERTPQRRPRPTGHRRNLR